MYCIQTLCTYWNYATSFIQLHGISAKSFPFVPPCYIVHAPLGLGMKEVLEWAKVSHWLGNGLVICLYELGQSAFLELVFWVELGLSVIS